MLAEHAVDGGTGDTVVAGQLTEAMTAAAIPEDGGVIQLERPASDGTCWGHPRTGRESFSFEWGTLLQLGDDLQDVREDLKRGSASLFSRAAALGTPLDDLAIQLLNFSERVGSRMDELPNGSRTLKALLKMSWRSLIIGGVADSCEFFTARFLKEAERCSPFRFSFLRKRRKKLISQQGLYTVLFDAFLEAPARDDKNFPVPNGLRLSCCEPTADPLDANICA